MKAFGDAITRLAGKLGATLHGQPQNQRPARLQWRARAAEPGLARANFQLFINKQFSASDRYPRARDIHFDLCVRSPCGRLKLATNSEGQVHDFSLETLSRARVR